MNPEDAYKFSPYTGEKLKKISDKVFFDSQNQKHIYLSPKIASDVVIKHENEILLVERAKDPGKGTLNLPGGFVELNETLEEAAVREVREETGISLDIAKLTDLKSFSERYLYQGINYYVLVGRFTYNMNEKPEVNVSDDAASFEWVDINEIDYEKVFEPHRKFIQDLL